jgi:hypothetical protein
MCSGNAEAKVTILLEKGSKVSNKMTHPSYHTPLGIANRRRPTIAAQNDEPIGSTLTGTPRGQILECGLVLRL